MPALVSLRLNGNRGLPNLLLLPGFVGGAHGLAFLDLSDCGMSQPAGSQVQVNAMRSVLDLRLGGNNLTDVVMGFSASSPLSSLSLDGLPLGRKLSDLSLVTGLPNLRALSLRGTAVTGPLADVLGRVHLLEHLDITGSDMRSERLFLGGAPEPMRCYGTRMNRDECVPTVFLSAGGDVLVMVPPAGAQLLCTQPQAATFVQIDATWDDYFEFENCACGPGYVGAPSVTPCQPCCDGCDCGGGELGQAAFPLPGRWLASAVGRVQLPPAGNVTLPPTVLPPSCDVAQECEGGTDACAPEAASDALNRGALFWDACAAGRAGRLCGRCADGFRRRGVECVPCGGAGGTAVGAAGAAAATVALWVYLYRCNPSGSGAVAVLAAHAQTSTLVLSAMVGGASLSRQVSSAGSFLLATPALECVDDAFSSARAHYFVVVALVLMLTAAVAAVRAAWAACGGKPDSGACAARQLPLLGAAGAASDEQGDEACRRSEATPLQRAMRVAAFSLFLLALPSVSASVQMLRWSRDECTGDRFLFRFPAERYSATTAVVASAVLVAYLAGVPAVVFGR